MADTPIDIDFNNMFANPDIYAEQYSEGSQSLYKLLKYCMTIKKKTIACCKGDNSSYAYIFFACTDQELPLFRTVIKNLKSFNIADFNYEVRAHINFKNCDKLRGVILRANPYAADLLFEKTLFAIQNSGSFSNRDMIDYFNSMVFYFNLKQLDTKDMKLIYYKNEKIAGKDNVGKEKYYLKFFEKEYIINGHKVYLNGPTKKLSSLTPESTLEDLKGIFEIDDDCDFKTVNQKVLSKILK